MVSTNNLRHEFYIVSVWRACALGKARLKIPIQLKLKERSFSTFHNSLS